MKSILVILVTLYTSNLYCQKYLKFFYCTPTDISSCDSLKFVGSCKVFYSPAKKNNKEYIKSYKNFGDSLFITTCLVVSKKNNNGYIINTLNDSAVIEIFELKNYKVTGIYTAYDLRTINRVLEKTEFKNGDWHGHSYQYGSRNGKDTIVRHKLYKNGRLKKIFYEN